MIKHLVISGYRALTASIILAGVMIYAIGDLSSPEVNPIVGASIFGFFVFWLIFAFMFGPRPAQPVYDSSTDFPEAISRGNEGSVTSGHCSSDGGGDGGNCQ